MLFIPQLNSIERLGLSTSNIRQCYQLNKFTFSDAINTAKSTAMQCISNKINEGKTIVDNAINDIQSAVQDVAGGAQLMAECARFTIQFPSVAGLVARVTCLSQVCRYSLFQCNGKLARHFPNSRNPTGNAEHEKWRHSITN